MSNVLLSSLNINTFTGILQDHFDFFSSGKWLGVHKEPKKVIINEAGENYPGYGDISNEVNYTLVPVSGIFPVVRVYNKENEQQVEGLNVNVPGGAVRIKVTEEARNFIKDGRNEYFELEGFTFNEAIEETPQNYLGKIFYRFTLKRTV